MLWVEMIIIRITFCYVQKTTRGCIRIKVFDTPFIFRLHENQINLKGMTFRDFSKLFYSQGVKLDKIAKTGQIGDYFPRFWSVSLFLSTFSSD